MVAWPATFKCNQNCISCILDTPITFKIPDPPLEQVKKLIDDMDPKKDILEISGGEPTLRKELFEVFDYVRETKPELYTFMVTNGVRLGDGIVERTDTEIIVLPEAPFAATSTDELLASGDTTASDHTAGDIVVCGDDRIFQAKEDTTAGELVTSSKYQKIDQITRQDIIAISETGYVSYVGVDTCDDLYFKQDSIANMRSWSILAEGLYSDGTQELVAPFVVLRRNSGIFDERWNSYGTATNTSGSLVTSVYDCFNLAHSGGDIESSSYEGDGFYDKIMVKDIQGDGGTVGISQIVSTAISMAETLYITGA